MQGEGANLIVDSNDDGKLVKVISIRGCSLSTNDQVPVNACILINPATLLKITCIVVLVSHKLLFGSSLHRRLEEYC